MSGHKIYFYQEIWLIIPKLSLLLLLIKSTDDLGSFKFFSTIFQLYQDDGMVILKDSVLLQGSNMVFHALTFARSRGRC